MSDPFLPICPPIYMFKIYMRVYVYMFMRFNYFSEGLSLCYVQNASWPSIELQYRYGTPSASPAEQPSLFTQDECFEKMLSQHFISIGPWSR